MKKLCIIIAFVLMLYLCGCSQRRITKTYVTAVTEDTTTISPNVVLLSNSTVERSAAEDGRTDKHLACVICVKDDSTKTLLVNIYDELGRIINTTSGDVSFDYEYDKDSRLIKESKYYNGFYQGCYRHEYVGNSHNKTAYSADGNVVYDGETYSEFWNNAGQPSGKIIYISEKERYTSMVRDYDKETGYITSDYTASQNEVKKDLEHRYEVNEHGNLVETVTDGLSGESVSETTYLGVKRSGDKIIKYEEYDSEGNTIRGFDNHYVEINGRTVLDSKAMMEINAISGKIKADIYFYSTSEFDIKDDIYEFIGMEPNDFSSLTVHMVSSGYDDIAVTYGGSGTKMKTLTSKRDDSGRVIEVVEKDKEGKFVSVRTFEYDSFGNCIKMTVEEGEEITEYIFGYISVPNSYCEVFTCAHAEEYIGE